jgi:phosphoribosylformimino-5-aminoimidazole carboxamide ribotide isomerase
MRIIPVLDLQRGRAVHARGGEREHYQPVRSILHEGSDPIAIARAFRDQLRCTEIYVADLDAIAGAPPATTVYRALLDLGFRLWLDAGVHDVPDVAVLIEAGISVVVLGLETLAGWRPLEAIVRRFDRERLAFSLDLRGREPIVASHSDWVGEDAASIAARAIALGVRQLIVLDVARVGTGLSAGEWQWEAQLAKAHPSIEILAGGGVGGVADLVTLAQAGVSAALVASALHDGRIGRDDLDRIESRTP